MSEPKKKQWIVEMRCVVMKEVICEDCTEEEAAASPFDHATSEREIEQIDWEVVDVTEDIL